MTKYTIDEIFKTPEAKHGLNLFDRKLISSITLYDKNGKPYLKCFGSDKERPAKPEEIVRQLFIKKLLDNYGYPKECIQGVRVWVKMSNRSLATRCNINKYRIILTSKKLIN